MNLSDEPSDTQLAEVKYRRCHVNADDDREDSTDRNEGSVDKVVHPSLVNEVTSLHFVTNLIFFDSISVCPLDASAEGTIFIHLHEVIAAGDSGDGGKLECPPNDDLDAHKRETHP